MLNTVHVGLLFTYAHSYYRNVLRGIRKFAEARPSWVFMPVFVEKGRLSWRGDVAPEGLIATVNNSTFAKAVKRWRRPIVNVSAVRHELPYSRVAVDNNLVGRLVAEHFLERGFRNFAFAGHCGHLYSVEREAAFRTAIRQAGFDVASYSVRRNHPFETHAQHWYFDRRVHAWLLGLPKPVGIFVPSDLFGVELTEICQDVGLRVPDEVALVGVDNDEVYCDLARPSLSSVILATERVGYEAGRLLDHLLCGGKAPKAPVFVPPIRLHVRQSSDVLAIDDEHVAAALRFIREHAHLAITVGNVLEAVPVSRRALELRFRRVLGRGVAQEICRVRLDRSKRLLAETDFQIPAVAHQSGFTTRQLAATFRRELGSSPTEFRKETRLKGDGR